MKIQNLSFRRFRNDEHFQYHQEFKKLVEVRTPTALNVEELFTAYSKELGLEEEASNTIQKNYLTGSVKEADTERDDLVDGLSDMVKAAQKHYSAEVREAARKVKPVFDHYGKLSSKSYNEETAGITTMVDELQTKYADELGVMKLTEWVTAVKESNLNFAYKQTERYAGDSNKTLLKMKEVRFDVDKAYNSLIDRLNALLILYNEEIHIEFARELNTRIDYYKNNIARRYGHSGKDTSKPDSEE